MSARITRDDEGINLYFTDYANRYEVSGEFAYDFIVDYDCDDNALGLEILLNESRRAGMDEEPLLAFGIFGTALAGLRWRYQADVVDTERPIIDVLRRRLDEMIAALNLGFRVSSEQPGAPFDLAILDVSGNLLIAVDLRVGKFHQDRAQQYIKTLNETVLSAHTGAIGICVFIDLTGQSHRKPPVKPGRWIDWPEANLPGGGHIWAHIAIIPPVDREYPWLPKTFLPSRYEVEVGA